MDLRFFRAFMEVCSNGSSSKILEELLKGFWWISEGLSGVPRGFRGHLSGVSGSFKGFLRIFQGVSGDFRGLK